MKKHYYAIVIILLLYCSHAIAQTQPWSTIGNANTNHATNFIGTTDRMPLVFRVNNLRSGIVAWQDTTTSFGYLALSSNSGGRFNTAMGFQALMANTKGKSNTAMGSNTLTDNTTGEANSAFGSGALNANIEGRGNSAFGSQALQSNSRGISNTAFGVATLYSTTGDNNTAFGTNALEKNQQGNNNTALGFGAGHSNLGSNNVFIGYMAGYNAGERSNLLYIANNELGAPLIFGNFATKRIGLGTIGPQATLHVVGNVIIEDSTQGYGKVLTSDASGLARWANPTSGTVAVQSDVATDGTPDGQDAVILLSSVDVSTINKQDVLLLGQICFKKNSIVGGIVKVAVLRDGVKVATISQFCEGRRPHTISINWVDKPEAPGAHKYELKWGSSASRDKINSKSLIAVAVN